MVWEGGSFNAAKMDRIAQDIRAFTWQMPRRWCRRRVTMVRRKDSEDEPETLLDIVRRARVLARALSEPDRTRILEYVEELEAEVASLKAGNSQAQAKARSQKGR